MQIETERLLLRRLNESDAPEFFQTVGDPEVMRSWGKGAAKTEEDALWRIRKMEDLSLPKTLSAIVSHAFSVLHDSNGFGHQPAEKTNLEAGI